MPNGIVYNAPQVANNTGVQDRVLSIDYNKMTVKILMSDGFYGGHQYFYHLVTDASDSVPAAIENGIYAAKLKYLPAFDKNTLADNSALRGFALAGNGETGINNPQRQGLNSTIVDGGLEPINIFQQDPENNKENSNYSPMWDAHVYFWTDAAINTGQRRRLHSLDEVKSLLSAGSIMSDPMAKNPPNPIIAGLKNNGLIINCPVIWQPLNSYNN